MNPRVGDGLVLGVGDGQRRGTPRSAASGGGRARLGRWLLVGLILLAFAKTALGLGSKSLWWDESLSLLRAQGSLAEVLSSAVLMTDNLHQVRTIDPHPPLYFLVLWLAVRLFGTTEFALRFLSLGCAVAVVPLLYATGCRLAGRRVGLAAAALGALSPLYLWYGQESRMYSMLALLSLLSFYCYYRAFFDPLLRPDSRRKGMWMGAYGLASFCVIGTHFNGAVLVAFELLGLAWVFLRQPRARRALWPTIAVLTAVLALAPAYVWYHMHLTDKLSVPARFVPVQVIARDLLNSFSLGMSVDIDDWFVLAADLTFLVLLLLGLVSLLRPGSLDRERVAACLLVGYLVVPFLLLYLCSYVQPAYMNSRHLILICPAFELLVAAGLTVGRSRGRSARRWGTVLLLALGWPAVIGGTAYSTYGYLVDPRYGKDSHREWGAYLRGHVRPGDVVVLSSPYSAALFEYYAGGDAPWIGLPLLDTPQAETVATLEKLLRQYDRVWLAVSDNTSQGGQHKLIEQWLNERAFRTDHQVFAAYSTVLKVACYLPNWPSVERLPDDARPVESRFGSALRLAGYRIVSPPTSGGSMHVQLYWAVDKTGPTQAAVALRLVDAEGHVWGHSEQLPFNGLYPMWQWQAGLLLRDEHDILVSPGTPPGAYELEMTLLEQPEDSTGVARRPLLPLSAASQRGDGILLGELKVERPGTPPSLRQLEIGDRRRVRFDGLELVGLRIESTEPRPGDLAEVVLSWQAGHGSLADQRFRLRLVDSAGHAWQESIIRPAGDGYPTDRWQSGDRFQGRFWLRLAEDSPTGRYRVELLPEPPLRARGVLATVRGWLMAGLAGVELGSLHVSARPVLAPATPPPLPTASPASHPLLATLGDSVRLLGYDLSHDTVRAGETLTLTLYWQGLRPMDVDYTVFLHLLDPANRFSGQRDGMPANGGNPTSSWETGSVVTDVRAFAVDPAAAPGRHTLEVGMYRLETLQRLPVKDASSRPVAEGRIVLSQVTVQPSLSAAPSQPTRPIRAYLPLVATER